MVTAPPLQIDLLGLWHLHGRSVRSQLSLTLLVTLLEVSIGENSSFMLHVKHQKKSDECPMELSLALLQITVGKVHGRHTHSFQAHYSH